MAKKTLIKLPGFEGVESSGGRFHIAAGEYRMKCTGVTEGVSSNGNEQLVFKFDGTEKAAKGLGFRLYCTTKIPNALWKLKDTVQALGVEALNEPSDLDPDDVVGVEVIGTVIDNNYGDRPTNSTLDAVRAAGGAAADDADKPSSKPAAASKKKNGDTKFAASEVEEMDEDELFELNEKFDLGVQLDAFKTTKKKAGAIISAMQANKMLEL